MQQPPAELARLDLVLLAGGAIEDGDRIPIIADP